MKKNMIRSWSIPAALALLFIGGVGLASNYQASLISQAVNGSQTPTAVPQNGTIAPTTPQTEEAIKPSSDAENILNNAKNNERYLSDQRRELNDIKRDVKTLDASKAESFLSQYETCLQALKACPSTVTDNNYGVCWDQDRTCQDISRDFQNEMDDNIRPARDCANSQKNVSDRKREKKDNIDRQVKDILRQDKNADVSQLNSIASQIDANFTRADQYSSAACTTDARDSLRDIQSELDGLFSDWYDASRDVQETAGATQRVKDFERQLKDSQRQSKDMSREINRYLKQKINIPELQAAYNGYQKALTAAQQCLVSKDIDCLQEQQQNMGDAQNDFWQTNQEANEKSNQANQLKECSRQLKDKLRELKDEQREYARILKQNGGRDVPELKDELDQFTALAQEAQDAFASGNVEDCFNEYLGPINEHAQNFHQIMGEKGKVLSGDFTRWLKDTEREWTKDRVRQLSDMKRDPGLRDAVSSLQDLLKKAQGIIAQAKEAYAAGDGDRVEDLLNGDLQQLRFEWDELMQSFNDKRESEYRQFEVKNVLEMIGRAKQEFERLLQEGNEEAGTCISIAGQAEDVIESAFSQIQSGQEPLDIEAGLEPLKAQADGIQLCKEVFDRYTGGGQRVDVRQFAQQFDLNISQDKLESIIQKVSDDAANRVLERLATKLNKQLAEQLISVQDSLQSQIANLLDATSTFVPEEYQDKLLNEKADLLSLGEQLKGITGRGGCENVSTVLSRIENANLIDESADEMQQVIGDFVSRAQGLSGQSCRNAVNSLLPQVDNIIAQGQDELFEKRVVPFRDTGVDQYYTSAVAELASRGIVSGMKDTQGNSLGMFNPAAKVKVTEMLRMIFEATGAGKVDYAPEVCGGKYSSHWAAGYIAQAESSGLEIVSSCSDLNRDATRAEVVQMILEATQTVVPNNNYSAYAQKIGLIKGDPNGNLRLNDTINRAEAATVVKRALNTLIQQMGG